MTRFFAQDFMGLRFVEFVPKGRMTVLTGKNSAGKTSIITAIWSVFLGAKYVPQVPTRRGATDHEIRVTIDGEQSFIAKRNQRSPLRIEMQPGSKAWGTPQEMMDSITNKFMLDPIAFVKLGRGDGPGIKGPADGKKAQVDYLSQAITLAVDPTKLDTENEADFRRRREIGRDVDMLKGQIAGIPVNPNLPAERPEIDAIQARIRAANEHNSTVVAQLERRQQLAQALAEAEKNEQRNRDLIGVTSSNVEGLAVEIEALNPAMNTAADIRVQLEELHERSAQLGNRGERLTETIAEACGKALGCFNDAQERIQQARQEMEIARKTLTAAEKQRRPLAEAVAEARLALEQAPVPVMQDITPIAEELTQAQAVNREMDRRDRAQELTRQKDELEAQVRALTRAMELRDQQKADAIINAKMPLEGLTFNIDKGKEEVLYQGVPLTQLGEAQQIKVSIAIGLAMQPELRLVCIPNGEALDDDSLAELEEMAEEKDFHVIIAKVDSSGTMGIFLEEGEVKRENPSPAKKTKTKEELA